MLLVDVVHREDGELPSTPYQSLPSQAPSRGHHHHDHRGSGEFSPAFTSSTSSSTAALIQADVFCSARVRPAMLLRLRIFFFLLLLAGAITAPLCEYAGGRCRMGVSRDDESLGERGTLAGEGQPEPDGNTPPASAHMRTVWMVSSLSFVTSLALLLYFALLLAVTRAYRLLFKQCCSYDYQSLSVVSSSSTAAHPLVPAMKLAALLFQLVVPTTIGVCLLYFASVLPWRRPLSWPISMHLHLLTGLVAITELWLSRFLFRLKALVYWCFLCLSYISLLMALYIGHQRWEYPVLSRTRSLPLALLTWLGLPVLLGPGCFLLAAAVQYARDGATRGVFTSPVDIGACIAAQHNTERSVLHNRGEYIHGALERYASDSDAAAAGAAPPRTPARGSVSGNGISRGDQFSTPLFSPNRSFMPFSGARPGSNQGHRSLNAHSRLPPPSLDWPVVSSQAETAPETPGWIGQSYRWVTSWWSTPQ